MSWDLKTSPLEYLETKPDGPSAEDAARELREHPAEIEDGGVPLVVGVWHTMPNYGCPKCPYASLDKWRTREHYVETHVRPTVQPKEPRLVVPTDRFGNEIKE